MLLVSLYPTCSLFCFPHHCGKTLLRTLSTAIIAGRDRNCSWSCLNSEDCFWQPFQRVLSQCQVALYINTLFRTQPKTGYVLPIFGILSLCSSLLSQYLFLKTLHSLLSLDSQPCILTSGRPLALSGFPLHGPMPEN